MNVMPHLLKIVYVLVYQCKEVLFNFFTRCVRDMYAMMMYIAVLCHFYMLFDKTYCVLNMHRHSFLL